MSTSQSDGVYSVRDDVKLYLLIAYASANDVNVSEEGRNNLRSPTINQLYRCSAISVRDHVKLCQTRKKRLCIGGRSRTTMYSLRIVAYASTEVIDLVSSHKHILPSALRPISSLSVGLKTDSDEQKFVPTMLCR